MALESEENHGLFESSLSGEESGDVSSAEDANDFIYDDIFPSEDDITYNLRLGEEYWSEAPPTPKCFVPIWDRAEVILEQAKNP